MLNPIQKRFLLFLIGCMGLRTLFVLVARKASMKLLPILGLLAILPAIGFTYIYLTGSRPTGGEVFGDKIWWNVLRPVHALLYALFAYYAITKQRTAWKFLAIDVVVGFISFLAYHTVSGNLGIMI